jgi:hypothetical protein
LGVEILQCKYIKNSFNAALKTQITQLKMDKGGARGVAQVERSHAKEV